MRMLNVMPPASNTFDRLIDYDPAGLDRIDRFIDQRAPTKHNPRSERPYK